MKANIFKKNLQKLHSDNSTLKYVVLGLFLLVLMLSATLMMRTQVVTIVPPNLNETAWIDKNTASAPYMRAWSVYLAQTLGNANPATVEMVKDSIGPFLDSSIYTATMKRLDDQIDQLKRDRISLSFVPTRVVTDPIAPGTYFIEGNQSFEGITGKPVMSLKTFEIKIDIKGYRPVITYITIKPGRAVLPSEAATHQQSNPQGGE